MYVYYLPLLICESTTASFYYSMILLLCYSILKQGDIWNNFEKLYFSKEDLPIEGQGSNFYSQG